MNEARDRKYKKLVLEELQAARGIYEDNLVRATLSFRGLSPKEMQKEHGNSGETRAQILGGYKIAFAEINGAIEWVKGKL